MEGKTKEKKTDVGVDAESYMPQAYTPEINTNWMILIPSAHSSTLCQGLMFDASGPLNHFVQTQGLQHKRTTDRGSGGAGSHELRVMTKQELQSRNTTHSKLSG